MFLIAAMSVLAIRIMIMMIIIIANVYQLASI